MSEDSKATLERRSATPPVDASADGARRPSGPALSRRRFLREAGSAGVMLAVLSRTGIAAAHGEDEDEAEATSTRVRRWAMVVDLRRCDGCRGLGIPPQCTQYCIWSRAVPEGQEWTEVHEIGTGEVPARPDEFLPLFCMQCQNAPCVNVCPVGASFHTPEGIVLIDQERCIGCRLCMAACPYDRRFFNWGDPEQLDSLKGTPYDVRTQTPARRGTVMKCDFCIDRAAAGGLPPCVDGCPRAAIYYGDLEEDVASNGIEMVQLSRFIAENDATRYKEELGTEPRVWYIPGHGELAGTGEGEPRFSKDRLEWPWRELNEVARTADMPNG